MGTPRKSRVHSEGVQRLIEKRTKLRAKLADREAKKRKIAAKEQELRRKTRIANATIRSLQAELALLERDDTDDRAAVVHEDAPDGLVRLTFLNGAVMMASHSPSSGTTHHAGASITCGRGGRLVSSSRVLVPLEGNASVRVTLSTDEGGRAREGYKIVLRADNALEVRTRVGSNSFRCDYYGTITDGLNLTESLRTGSDDPPGGCVATTTHGSVCGGMVI